VQALRPVKPAHVVVAHNRVAADADPSTADVLQQVALVEAGLDELGVPYAVTPIDPPRLWEHLDPVPGTIVFNLIEAPPGAPQLQPVSAAVLEALGVSFTGASAAAMWITTDKLATRAVLAAEGLPVAAGGRFSAAHPAVLEHVPPPWILKPAWEDASLGLDGEAVCSSRDRAVARGRELERRFPGQPVLVEHFLPGREFNVSLLAAGAGGGELLPVAEIAFVDFPADVPALVGYEAKWEAETFAYEHTVRRFPDDTADAALLDEIRALAAAAWRLCDLRGYGRVDMRLDEGGRPRILEVNANPCLAADAGFMAAAGRAGLSPADVVGRILAAAGQAIAAHRRGD
jgi:D-alanine-D-alanine ligase